MKRLLREILAELRGIHEEVKLLRILTNEEYVLALRPEVELRQLREERGLQIGDEVLLRGQVTDLQGVVVTMVIKHLPMPLQMTQRELAEVVQFLA